MSPSSSRAFGLVRWDSYSGRPGNTHAALHGCKQGMAVQNTTFLALDGKFKKKSLSHLGPTGHKERHFHAKSGGEAAAWSNAAEIWI